MDRYFGSNKERERILLNVLRELDRLSEMAKAFHETFDRPFATTDDNESIVGRAEGFGQSFS